jgi:hypothetical protein
MASGTAASVKLCATGLQRPRVLTLKIELMSACVKMLWGERRGYGTFGAVQQLPTEHPHVAIF